MLQEAKLSCYRFHSLFWVGKHQTSSKNTWISDRWNWTFDFSVVGLLTNQCSQPQLWLLSLVMMSLPPTEMPNSVSSNFPWMCFAKDKKQLRIQSRLNEEKIFAASWIGMNRTSKDDDVDDVNDVCLWRHCRVIRHKLLPVPLTVNSKRLFNSKLNANFVPNWEHFFLKR